MGRTLRVDAKSKKKEQLKEAREKRWGERPLISKPPEKPRNMSPFYALAAILMSSMATISST